MYAILFDLDTDCLGKSYNRSISDTYNIVRTFLEKNGFEWKQGSVYFARRDEGIDAASCVLAVQRLTKAYPWFGSCVRDIRMLRIEENNDLRPNLEIILEGNSC